MQFNLDFIHTYLGRLLVIMKYMNKKQKSIELLFVFLFYL